ncbi:hypothetical protein D3C73_1547530 [compost metagenome]
MCQLQPANAIANRINMWFCRLHMFIDTDISPIQSDIGIFQSDIFQVTLSANGYQKLITSKDGLFLTLSR